MFRKDQAFMSETPDFTLRLLVRRRHGGFTIIELLVAVGIIAVLMALVIPSLRGARTSAKNVATQATFSSIARAMEMFKNDNTKEFRRTNGYPRSSRGPDENTNDSSITTNVMYGAHWLPRHLLGKDFEGFIPRENVPKDCLNQPETWYTNSPCGDSTPLDRRPLYVEADAIKMVQTKDLTGVWPEPATLLDRNQTAPVFVDHFDRPILYYAANPYGTIMATRSTAPVGGGDIGTYVHEDNAGFTGLSESDPAYAQTGMGLQFTRVEHTLAAFGDVDPSSFDEEERTFASYIHDHGIHEATESQDRTKIKPVNGDLYLLISTGEDGAYGTPDDVNNFGN
jgi:prepilin-type N-terminal cleavage/methylation domain-containing protein